MDNEITHWLELPASEEFLRFGDLPDLIADALWPCRDESDMRLRYGAARVNLEDELPKAVNAGRLEVLDPLTFGPHTFPHGEALTRALVRVSDLRRYLLETRRMGISFAEVGGVADKGAARSLPLFAREARPQQVPPRLLALAPDTIVRWEDSNGVVQAKAGEVRALIEEVIARQAEGYFTLEEAAQVLADSRPGLDAREAVNRFRTAHAKGQLPIHKAGSRFPMEAGETIRDFHDQLEVSELDAWLRASAGYGFPAAVSPAQAVGAKKPKDRLLTLAQIRLSQRPGDFERFADFVNNEATMPTMVRFRLLLLSLPNLGGVDGPTRDDAVLLSLIDEWADANRSATVRPLPATEVPEPETRSTDTAVTAHTAKRRSDPLAAVLAQAARQALDSADWSSVWAAFVALAQCATRPAPLLGYVEGEGVKYQVDDANDPVRYLSREAFRGRFRRTR